ncbi:diguanylate cyclase (GGDEF)-like protein/PAS domain S-box-containing protein [Azospirillum lipoferum]|uniref:EAL domain-containing protein n=1 Tax=Azospirillum lipoferum TaxID=193 RepID=A0A5A9GWA3_AZOLI|nr:MULTISPECIES: GGDEF domain-containing phosphodiesterase [Azospirillum]KAA0597719.1 EAL domain-containing protein [Azospirillum lipoferum]MCP1610148.1 diguanylate cyclase (GGDEF)-like protein/PAS domain S-box-containing protein [Azospirillum lipoferum]MDW5534359.1 EAL domain-containing protein [Azospirillum sp. NL1]
MSPDPRITALADALSGAVSGAPGLDALRQILDAMTVKVALMDPQRRHIYANRAYLEMMGTTLEKAVGTTIGDLLGPDQLRNTVGAAERALAGETVQTEGWITQADGLQRYVTRLHAPHRAEDGAITGYFVILQDMTERRQVQDDLFRLAYYDPVTGLANRLMLLKHMADYRNMGEPFTLVILDIDRFAEIRSSMGQGFANEVLDGLAQRMAAQAAAFDLIARVSDHAFAMLAGGSCDRPALESAIEELAAVVRSARSSSGGTVFLSASIGVAVASPTHERPDDVLRDAEIATARAREQGGGRQAWFDPAMHSHVVEQVRLEHDLRSALDSGSDLWVAYQPIVEMVTGGLAGFEALMRWNHPERGNIPPGIFIPIAESTGLVVSLGTWVLRQACLQIAEWQDRREPGSAPLFMSINLSTHQLSDPNFVQVVREVLRETGVEPSWIKLELTESAVMDKAEQSIRLLRDLRALGIKLSIDDFGTGYSSLSYLHKLPIDSLKVDRSFVSAMHQSEENRAIVRIIMDLARLLGFDVIAEGIETSADANLLRALACDYGQGYHFARPLPSAEAGKLVGGELPWQMPR